MAQWMSLDISDPDCPPLKIAANLKQPDLNALKNYVMHQQKLNYQLIKEYELKAR